MNNQLVKIIPGDKFTPLSLARKLGARVILESSTYQKGRERYSLLMIDEAFTLVQRITEVFISFPVDGSHSVEKRIRSKARDILDVLRYFADQHGSMHQDFPFPAGALGIAALSSAGSATIFLCGRNLTNLISRMRHIFSGTLS
jgi:anthranilate synthase component 1